MRAVLEQLVPPVYRFALRLTGDGSEAEDLTQETMLRAWRFREQLREPTEARLWLFRIAVNLHRDAIRRSRVRARPPRDVRREPVESAERSLERREEVDAALAALDDLPDRQREVLYLAACEECSIGEIARILDITPDAAKASLSLARRRMRDRLGAERPGDMTNEHA